MPVYSRISQHTAAYIRICQHTRDASIAARPPDRLSLGSGPEMDGVRSIALPALTKLRYSVLHRKTRSGTKQPLPLTQVAECTRLCLCIRARWPAITNSARLEEVAVAANAAVVWKNEGYV